MMCVPLFDSSQSVDVDDVWAEAVCSDNSVSLCANSIVDWGSPA